MKSHLLAISIILLLVGIAAACAPESNEPLPLTLEELEEKLIDAETRLGQMETVIVEGQEQKQRITTTRFATEVRDLEELVGRQKIEKDGTLLAIEYLHARASWQAYYDLPSGGSDRTEFRKQFPDVEARLFLWGKMTTLKNPKSVEKLFALMREYNIQPESIPAFNENMDRHEEMRLAVEEGKGALAISIEWYDTDCQYEQLTKDAQVDFLGLHPQYTEARIRRHAYLYGIPEEWIDTYVEYVQSGYTGDKRNRWLMVHKDFYEAVKDIMGWESLDTQAGVEIDGGLPGMIYVNPNQNW